MFPLVSKDPRLAPLLQGVHRQYVGQDFSQQKALAGTITPENIDLMAERSMPLCMRQLHKGRRAVFGFTATIAQYLCLPCRRQPSSHPPPPAPLPSPHTTFTSAPLRFLPALGTAVRRDHKLKHAGRQQYWLFLKGAGMSMEDSMRFFHSEFSRIMSSEAFNKEHAYNIRHAYGKEGKRTNYTPYSCMKIIMGGAPGHGEHHGCPYRYMDESHLSTLFGSMKISGAQKESIFAPLRKGHFQVACQRHFEVTHPGAAGRGVNLDGVGNHPNSWTAASMEYHRDDADKSTRVSSGAGQHLKLEEQSGAAGSPTPAAATAAAAVAEPDPAQPAVVEPMDA